MQFHKHLENLKKLNLPTNEYVIVTSGVLAVRGIRDVDDLDIIVTDSLWLELLNMHKVIIKDGVSRIDFVNGIEILDPDKSIFGRSGIIPFDEIFNNADIFDGIRYMNLEHLKKIKQTLGRPKDLKDIELIDKYLNKI